MLKTFLLAPCCSGCVFTLIPQDLPSLPADRDSDSDEVYAAVVDWRIAHAREGPKAKRLVFSDTTVRYSCFTEKPEDCASKVREQLTQAFGQEPEMGVLSNYLEHNKDRGPLSKPILTGLPKSWLSDAETEALINSKKHDGWESFYSKYPDAGGIMAFSRVGFNEKRDRAFLYSAIGCGWLCGTGHYHLLKRESAKWILSMSYMAEWPNFWGGGELPTQPLPRHKPHLRRSPALSAKLIDFCGDSVVQIENVNGFTAFHALGNHGQREQDYARTRKSYSRIAAVLFFHDYPFHLHVLYIGIAKDHSEALELVGLTWLETIMLKNRPNRSEFTCDRLVLLAGAIIREVLLDDRSLIAQSLLISLGGC
jgi:hypothetical protein